MQVLEAVEVGGGVPAKIAIEAPSEMFLMGQIWPAHTVKIEYQDEDASLETLKVLDQVPLTTQIDWDDDSKDTLLLVTKPKPQSGPALDPDLIGNCASLLNE